MNKSLKIVFMGTPDFAVPALEALHQNGYDVPLVVTQPDRPKGRGRKVVPPPVKKTAMALGYEIAQPASIKDDAFIDRLQGIKPDLFVVVAFGRILPREILSLPRSGAINIHASLLPKYRGPAPIQWAIINREKETGVTTMLMNEGLDKGDILMSSRVAIKADDTSAVLHDRLAVLGADLLIRTLRALQAETLKPIPQNHSRTSYAPLFRKKDGHIDWQRSAEDIEAFIRGMSPWPGAFMFHDKKRLKIFKAQAVRMDAFNPPGTVIESFPDELRIATGQGALSILEIQGASGKRLLVKDFLRGNRLPPGTVLS